MLPISSITVNISSLFILFLMLFSIFQNVLLLHNVLSLATADDSYIKNARSDIVNTIANDLVTLLLNNETSQRINELNDKIQKINQYVVDKDKYEELLSNVTKETKLNETNFFSALNERDHFSFLSRNETKSLYVKLKEKMTRDDISSILANRSDVSKIMVSARRMKGDGYIDDEIEDVVDKLIAELPRDDHKYDARDHESKYWDPKNELEDLRDFHKHRHDGRRLFRGERTSVRFYPFMASVHVMGRFWCGGVLYWHDLVITSAACLQLMHNNRFFRENPRVLQVRIGSNHSRIGGEVIDALEVYFHPGYNPRTLRNNIAVIRLRRHLFFNYHRIPKIIDISHNPSLVPASSEVLLLGWGVTRTSQKLEYEPIYLQRKFLPVYPNKFCQEVYGDKFVTSTMFCAGTFTTGEGACDHDAGGPAVLSGKLVGIISFGPSVCGFPNAPTVFTLVGAFADWIETVNESMPEYYRGKAHTTTTSQFPFTFHTEHTETTPLVAPLNHASSLGTLPPESERLLRQSRPSAKEQRPRAERTQKIKKKLEQMLRMGGVSGLESNEEY